MRLQNYRGGRGFRGAGMRVRRVWRFAEFAGIRLLASLALAGVTLTSLPLAGFPLASLANAADGAPVATGPQAKQQPAPPVAVDIRPATAADGAAAPPDVADAAPETTATVPQDPVAAAPVKPAVTNAAVQPDQTPDPFLRTEAPATPPAPVLAAPATTPSGTDGAPPSGTPAAAAPQAAPTFADHLHKALDAFVAKPIEGRDSKEIRRLRDAVAAFYASRAYAPLWVADGKPNAAAESVLARLAHADDDGLSLDGLPAPVFAQSADQTSGQTSDDAHDAAADALADAEINLTMQVVTYARQASGSRIEPHRIAALIGAKPNVPEPAEILTPVAAAGADAGTLLEGFNPPQAGYRALRDKLAELRREMHPMAEGSIPRGRALRVGMSDPRVPLIRAKFGLDAEPASTSESLLYDTRVAAAVAHFQKAYGLPASGILTARTIAVLSGGQPSRLQAELLANMEMWRWMPRDMGKDRIEVNIPDFTARVVRGGQVVWHNKVIVGKPLTPTPVFSNAVRYIIVNPYWNVPPSIIRKDMLPKLEQDPTYLARMGFEVSTRHGHLVVRQPPGPKNALGRIKFIFPNDYAVYLHDTPSRELFTASRRAFSHGCVRVDEPFGLAQAVMGPRSGWSERRVERLVGVTRHYINLPEPMPIHIEYFTAFVDAENHLQLRDDLYGYTRKVDLALGLANKQSFR